jgi:uncharacterized protein
VTPETFDIVLGSESRVTGRHYTASSDAGGLLVLAHGAGAGQDHPFLVSVARGLAARGLPTITFNFPYMERRSKVPNPAPQLEACYRRVVATVHDRGWLKNRALFLGGKSMGGRMASHLAAAPADLPHPIAGLVFLGYPLHPPGKPAQLRSAHLPAIAAPMLFVQGARDAFGTPDELAPILASIATPSSVMTIDRADHSFKVSGQSRAAQAAQLDAILDRIIEWVKETRPPR